MTCAPQSMGWKYWHNQPDKMQLALELIRDELLERIDGGEECRGRDTWISELIRVCDRALLTE